MTIADRRTRLHARTVRTDPPAVPASHAIERFVSARLAGEDAALWLQPDRGIAIVGIGRAWSVEPDGAGRFGAAADAWRELVAALRADDPDAAPILLGGLGFTGRPPAAGTTWGSFGASSLVLHETTWVTTPGGSTRTDVTGATGSRAPGARTASPVDPSAPSVPAPHPLAIVDERPDRAAWSRLVRMFAGAVGRGRLDKVVLARRVDAATLDGVPIALAAALDALVGSAPESTIYAFARGGADGPVFLGATPERLVRTDRRRFETVAIAGSAARAADPAEDARLAASLLASEKDREEHAVVVAMLCESLAPIVDELVVADAPQLLDLRHVRHLTTPVAGRLRDEAGLLALAERLHPTPAVGGEPRALALELIAEHEGFDRGWYAGPVGWVDAEGDGELCVALRCAVVRGSRATLFAGCGIVADSDADREWAESWAKLRAVGSALGGFDGPWFDGGAPSRPPVRGDASRAGEEPA